MTATDLQKKVNEFIAIIREEVQVNAKSIVVEFSGDPKKKQHFEVKFSFSPYQKGMRKWDSWELKIRFESEIFTEAKPVNNSTLPISL